MFVGATHPPILESLAVVTGCVTGAVISGKCFFGALEKPKKDGLNSLIANVSIVALAIFIGMIPVAPYVYFSMWSSTGTHSFSRLCSSLISPATGTGILLIGTVGVGTIFLAMLLDLTVKVVKTVAPIVLVPTAVMLEKTALGRLR
jgi:hypothetical protein